MSLLVTALFSFKSPANFHSVIHRLFSVNIHYPFRTGFYLTMKSKQVQVVNKCTAYSQVFRVRLLIQIRAFKKELIRTNLIFKCVNVFVFFCPHNTRILLSFASADGMFPGCFVDMCIYGLNPAPLSLMAAVWSRHGHTTPQTLLRALVQEDV